MAKLNYNRPVHQQYREWQKETGTNRKTPLDVKSEYEPAKMTFGKYKGFNISAIPSGYLEWLISVTTDDKFAIRYARELARRPDYIKRLYKK